MANSTVIFTNNEGKDVAKYHLVKTSVITNGEEHTTYGIVFGILDASDDKEAVEALVKECNECTEGALDPNHLIDEVENLINQ